METMKTPPTEPSTVTSNTALSSHADSVPGDSPQGQMPIDPSKSRVDRVLDVIARVVGLVTWPVLVLAALIVFYSPIRKIAEGIPEKVNQSSEIGIAGLNLKIAQRARTLGSAELAQVVSSLSPRAVTTLLEIGDSARGVVGSSTAETSGTVSLVYFKNDIWIELEEKHLLVADTPLLEFDKIARSLIPAGNSIPLDRFSANQRNLLQHNSVRLTAEGLQLHKVLMSVIAEAIEVQPPRSTGPADNK